MITPAMRPWEQGARWEGTGWVWRGLEPPHAPPLRRWLRVPTQLALKFAATIPTPKLATAADK
jgi:hypothetical protein